MAKKADERWIITWKPNSEYIGQEGKNRFPVGHTQTDIVDDSAENWAKNNPQKSILFCYKVK